VSLAAVTLFITTAIAGTQLGGFAAYLPLVILCTSALSITSIWIFGDSSKSKSVQLKKFKLLEAKIRELESRIYNVEIIEKFEDRLAEKDFQERKKSAQLKTKQSSQFEPQIENML
jgi:hypothetical protein